MADFIFNFMVKLIVVLTALPVHEFAHGYVAHLLGDDTAKYQGRLTLNPLAHLDPIGSIALLLFGFGWAKPVPINPHNFKNRKVGMAISSLAGPVSNILLALIFLVILKILAFFVPASAFVINIANVFSIMISINLGLAVFNLIPIPPLDGSRIATLFLPERIYFAIMRYEQLIFIGLILLMNTPIFNTPINIARNALFSMLDFLTSFIDVIARMVQ